MLNKRQRWLFVSTPKCATWTLYELLTLLGGERVGAYFHARPDQFVQRFASNVATLPGNLFTFSVCRNPLSRAVSLWWFILHKRVHHRQAFLAHSSGDTGFPAFVEWLTTCELPTPDPVAPERPGPDRAPQILTTQSRWHRKTGVDKFLHLEHLEEDFQTLPFVNKRWPIPKLNATHHDRKPWREYHTAETVERLGTWAAEDFARFGYSTQWQSQF